MTVSDGDIGKAARKLDLLGQLTDEEVAESLNSVRPDLYDIALDEAESRADRRGKLLLILFVIFASAGVVYAIWLAHHTLGPH